MKGDTLSILEAGYAETIQPDAWVHRVVHALAPHLDQGGGVIGQRFAHEADGFRHIGSCTGVHTNVEWPSIGRP